MSGTTFLEETMEQTKYSEYLGDLEELYSYIEARAAKLNESNRTDPYESAETKELSTAMAKAQGEFPRIHFNKENPFFKSGYADYDIIMNAVRPTLSKNGLWVSQFKYLIGTGETILVTRLRHSSGQWCEDRTRLLPPKNDPQSFASTLSYMKRHSLMALLGITASEDSYDDDAETVMHDVRFPQQKGTDLNMKYNPKEQSFLPITKEQREELEYELTEYPDIADMVLTGLRIQSLADMPKNKYQSSLTRIREIKELRNNGTMPSK